MTGDDVFWGFSRGRMKRVMVIGIGAAALTLVLFEVEFAPRFNLPGELTVPDKAQEARYQLCVDEADREIHAETFAAIDNPDVQREVLYRRKQAAKADCREQFPEISTTISVPLDVNLLDFHWRY